MGRIRIDQADKNFSKWIRQRDSWTCQRCGGYYKDKPQGLHCSHFQGRAKENTRFEPLNADSLCYGCHQYFTSHPAEHYAWQLNKKGQHVIDQLILASNTYKKKDRKLEALYWKQKLNEQA